MNKPAAIEGTTVLTASIDAETARVVAEVARNRGQTPEAFAAEAIRRVAESEADFDAFLKEGEDAIARGDYITHDEMIAHLQHWIDERKPTA